MENQTVKIISSNNKKMKTKNREYEFKLKMGNEDEKAEENKKMMLFRFSTKFCLTQRKKAILAARKYPYPTHIKMDLNEKEEKKQIQNRILKMRTKKQIMLKSQTRRPQILNLNEFSSSNFTYDSSDSNSESNANAKTSGVFQNGLEQDIEKIVSSEFNLNAQK